MENTNQGIIIRRLSISHWKNRVKKIVLGVLAVILMIPTVACSNPTAKDIAYNNFLSLEQSIHATYSKYEVEQFHQEQLDAYSNGGSYFTMEDVQKYFDIECTRKNCFGNYYVPLKLDEGGYAFIFLSPELVVKLNILVYTKMPSKDDFNFIKENETLIDEIRSFDFNTIEYPLSSVELLTTGHIVKEGVLIIRYRSGAIVKSVEFFPNESIPALQEQEGINWFVLGVPYLLPQDKQF